MQSGTFFVGHCVYWTGLGLGLGDWAPKDLGLGLDKNGAPTKNYSVRIQGFLPISQLSLINLVADVGRYVTANLIWNFFLTVFSCTLPLALTIFVHLPNYKIRPVFSNLWLSNYSTFSNSFDVFIKASLLK